MHYLYNRVLRNEVRVRFVTGKRSAVEYRNAFIGYYAIKRTVLAYHAILEHDRIAYFRAFGDFDAAEKYGIADLAFDYAAVRNERVRDRSRAYDPARGTVAHFRVYIRAVVIEKFVANTLVEQFERVLIIVAQAVYRREITFLQVREYAVIFCAANKHVAGEAVII